MIAGMNNWGFVRKNLKVNAKMSLQQNMLLCLKVTITALLAEVLISWTRGLLPAAYAFTPNEIKPMHSLVAIITDNPPVTIIIALLLLLAEVFLLAPLDVGTAGLYLGVVRKQGQEADKLKFKSVFDWYLKIEKSIKAFVLMLSMRLLAVFWFAVFCCVPAAAIYYYENTTQIKDVSQLPLSYAAIMTLLGLLLLAGTIFAMVRYSAYIPAPYLMSQNPELGVPGAIRQSGKLMRGHLWEYLMLEISFIPWYLLSLFTFGLSLLYFLPYRNACQAIFVRKRQFEKLVEQKHMNTGDLNDNPA